MAGLYKNIKNSDAQIDANKLNKEFEEQCEKQRNSETQDKIRKEKQGEINNLTNNT